MKERRGPIGQVAGIAEEIAAAVRRRQREREPRIALYDAAGHPRVIPPDSPGHAAVLGVAEALVELTARQADARPDGDRPAERGAAGGE